MSEDFGDRKPISQATIRSTAKRPTAMKILIFLKGNSDIYTTSEISDKLELNWCTVDYNLKKLLECGFVHTEETDLMDGRTHYYQIADGKSVEKTVEYYKVWVGYRLARLVPYNRIYAESLKQDKRFLEACQEFGLTISEGIQAVLRCPKIESEGHSNHIILWRKEQGYDEKKPEVEEIG